MASVPNTRPVVAEQLFATLLERLLGGEYDAAGKLPPQRDLAAELGVTMTALREALKRLEQMGLVEVRHGEAMWVRDWRRHGGLDVLVHVLLRGGGIDAKVLADILEARCHMLRELAGLAAERADAEATQRIGALAREFAEAEDAAAAAAVDYAFFTAVADAAANVVFVLILNAIRPIYFEHAHLLPVTARPQELAGLYAAIARAVAERDTEAARAAAWELALRQRERLVG